MSTFNLAVAEVRARSAGISFLDQCRRAQRASMAAKRRRKRELTREREVAAKRWDLREDGP